MVRLLDALEKGLMLFNSYLFIFLFLPVALAGYFALGRVGNLAPVVWLALASLVFYSVGNWQYVPLLRRLHRVQLSNRLSPDRAAIAPLVTVCRAHGGRRR